MKDRRALIIPLVLTVLLSLGSVLAAVLSDSSPTLGLDLQGGFSVVLQAREVDGQLPSEESVEKAKDIIRQRVDGLGVAEPEIIRQGRTVIVQLPGVTDRAKAEKLVGCTAKLEFRPVLAVTANPDAVKTTTTTTKAGSSKTTTTTKAGGSTTTTKAGGSTTTTKAGGSTTTAPGRSALPTGEFGHGSAGLSAGEGALPVQFAPTTTTTTAPPTTTTAAPVTTTTAPASTTTVAGGSTTTTAVATPTSSGGCQSGTILSKAALASATPPPAGGVVVPSKDGKAMYTLGPVGFTGDALSKAEASLQEEWTVSAAVKGSKKTQANAAFNACFNNDPTCPASATGNSDGHGSIAIVLDGQVLSAPAVNAADLASKSFVITGNFDQAAAKELALVLRYGSLPVEFEQAALQQVSATLGTDSLHAGLLAGFVGIAAVAVYMLFYYRGLGLVVISGLTVWGGLMYGLVCWLSANQGLALTLSGIIGIVVSVGTTVDSYVVYFERLKDEVRQGRSARSATERGFNSAIRTIITADVASFLGAFLLWWLTVGPVRGFAFFLGISVVLDLFVAYFFTRPVVALIGRSDRLSNSKFLGLQSTRDRAIEQTGATA